MFYHRWPITEFIRDIYDLMQEPGYARLGRRTNIFMVF